MSVVIETTLGDITVDLFLSQRPRACLNFLKLCKTKYYNFNLFHTISRGFIAQTGDPTGSRSGGESIFGILEGQSKRFFEGENEPRIKHTKMGLISFVGSEERMIGSQFFFTLGEDITYLDERHCVFGEVVEGYDILEVINEVICDTDDRPYQDVRITHTVILDDPYPDPKTLRVPSRSPSPNAERLQGGRIAPDEDVDETEGKNIREIVEMQAEREAKARATILEMVGDLPDADMAPPENVLFVCKLNPVTTDDDLEIIFNRFGKIKSCEVIRDRKTNDSLQYAFIEFENEKSCEDAYFKMDNILIDDRRIHVDFSQSVSKIKWHGKGRGVTHYDDRGKRTKDNNNEIGRGDYKVYSSDNRDLSRNNNSSNSMNSRRSKRDKSYSKSPLRNKNYSEKLRVELLSKKPDKDYQKMQSKTLRRISRSRSRSPHRRNYKKVSPRRRNTSKTSAYGKNHSDRRNTNYSRNRDRSRSPSNSSLTSRYSNENRRFKTSSRSNHDRRYSKSESRQESSNHFTREEIPQYEKHRFSNKKERYINESKENSHKKGIESSEDSESEKKNKINKEPNPRRNYSKAEVDNKSKNKKEIKNSRDLPSKDNKNQKKKQKYLKNSGENQEKARKRNKKSKDSSSDSSSESSSSDSSSDSSTSESSSSSSESDSSDTEVERRKKRKDKKRNNKSTDESSDSNSSIRNKSKKKRKKTQSSDSEESSRKKSKKLNWSGRDSFSDLNIHTVTTPEPALSQTHCYYMRPDNYHDDLIHELISAKATASECFEENSRLIETPPRTDTLNISNRIQTESLSTAPSRSD